MDLEDAVALDPKKAARNQIAAALLERGYGQRELIVRTNSLYSPWGEDDLKAVAGMGADAVLLPKNVGTRHGLGGYGYSRPGWWAHGPAYLVHDGNATGHAARRRNCIFTRAGRLFSHGDLGPGQGP